MIPDYISLWNDMKITNDHMFVDPVSLISLNQARYQKVTDRTGVPWQVVGALHYREASNSFSCHLHNGDPLSARTTHAPKGRPLYGSPPYQWEDSAIDALTYDGLVGLASWNNIASCLYRVERYNGLGYRGHNINSPYLWSGTNNYTVGKYSDDGVYNPTLVDRQAGVAGILKLLGYLQ